MKDDTPKRGPGRPAAMKGGRSRKVYIDDASWARAQKLGDGSASEGIRRALELAEKAV